MFDVSLRELIVVAIVLILCVDKKNPENTKNMIRDILKPLNKAVKYCKSLKNSLTAHLITDEIIGDDGRKHTAYNQPNSDTEENNHKP